MVDSRDLELGMFLDTVLKAYDFIQVSTNIFTVSTSLLICRYVSSDFGNHPLSHLMGSVFGMHSKENVEVCDSLLSCFDRTAYSSFNVLYYLDELRILV